MSLLGSHFINALIEKLLIW